MRNKITKVIGSHGIEIPLIESMEKVFVEPGTDFIFKNGNV